MAYECEPKQKQKLRYYKANSEVNMVKQWQAKANKIIETN